MTRRLVNVVSPDRSTKSLLVTLNSPNFNSLRFVSGVNGETSKRVPRMRRSQDNSPSGKRKLESICFACSFIEESIDRPWTGRLFTMCFSPCQSISHSFGYNTVVSLMSTQERCVTLSATETVTCSVRLRQISTMHVGTVSVQFFISTSLR